MVAEKDVFLADGKEPQARGIRLAYQPLGNGDTRWTISKIRAFLHGEEEAKNGVAVFDMLRKEYTKYVDFGDGRISSLLATWVIGSYLFVIFDSYPYLSFGGAKEVGKSKSLKLISFTAFNGKINLNPTEATVFRIVQQERPTICFDEFEYLCGDKRELILQILRAGYKRGGVVPRLEKVRRKGGEQYAVVNFDVYSPKAFASVYEVPDIAERCIKVNMLRSTDERITNTEPREDTPCWQEIRDELYPFALKNWKEIQELYKNLENETKLRGRRWELWKPLIVIAKYIDEIAYQEIKSLAEEMEEVRTQDEQMEREEPLILRSLITLLSQNEQIVFSIAELSTQLKEDAPELYDYERIRSTHAKIGRVLKRLNILRKRTGKRRTYILDMNCLSNLKERFGVYDE